MSTSDFSEVDAYPVPRDPCVGQPDDRRLWLGNLDSRVTEFALLKLLQKHGSLEKFDFLYHKAGPDRGKPRGYCFVTYSTKEEAERGRQRLHGKLALGKRLVVKYAHIEPQDVVPVNKAVKTTVEKKQEPAPSQPELSTETKIRAIEAKLQLMDQNFESSPSAGQVPASLSAVAPWTDPNNRTNVTVANNKPSANHKPSGPTNHRPSKKPYQRGSKSHKSHR